jgi:sulfate permease, SulP family
MMISKMRTEWFGNIRPDLLAGMVVALALIPEAIAFSIIAGVSPQVGLYTSFTLAVVIAFVGGRSGMISAATGAMAFVMINLVKDYGLQYLLAATVLTGIFQIIAGMLKLGSLLRFVSRSVSTAFVNALAILIFMAQLPRFVGAGWEMYAMVALGLAIIYLFPFLTKKVPSSLISILVITGLSLWLKLPLETVGDLGDLPSAFPPFLLPKIPLNWHTLQVITPYALALMVVGLLESLMTASLVDELTDTGSCKNRECRGQGIANVITGFFGGMAGCAMIGQTVINVKSGGRGRLSCFFAGAFLLFLILVLHDFVKMIPMAALVAVMVMVSIGTFDWSSLRNIKTHPKSASFVMIVTVAIVIYTKDLAIGVIVGVILNALFFSYKIEKFFRIESQKESDDHRVYAVHGQVFFASDDRFADGFNFFEVLDRVTVDVTHAHFWDISAATALDKVLLRFKREGTDVQVVGLNKASRTVVDKLGSESFFSGGES